MAATIADLMRATGASRSAIYRWRRNGWITQDPPWDIDRTVVAVHEARGSGPASERSSPSDAHDAPVGPLSAPGTIGVGDELRAARIQNEKLRAALRGLELRKLRGELIERAQVQLLLDGRMRTLKRSLMAVGRRLGRQLVNRPDPAEVQAEIDEEHERILWGIYGKPPAELDLLDVVEDPPDEVVQMTSTKTTWWPSERQIAKPPDRLTVSQWADKHRVLDPLNCSRPGAWQTDFAPYLRGIHDAFGDPHVREIVMMGSTQWGKTETLLNMLLYTVGQEPLPTLYVLPTEQDVTSFGARRLKSAIDHCQQVRVRRTRWKADNKMHELAFDGMVLYLGWANSPSRLAMRSIGRLFMDEVDKFPPFSGKEADPISLARERTRWYPDAKLVYASTPTTPEGYIWQLWQKSDRRWYWVPCPFCGTFQQLRFSRETVRWEPGLKDSDRMRRERMASYVCQKCERLIPDDDVHKRKMLAAGVWCPEGGHVDAAGEIRDAKIDARRQGFHVNALYSPVLSWSDVAAEFISSHAHIPTFMNFTNSWVGWPWIEKATEMESGTIRARARPAVPKRTVPKATVVLTAGVDVQKDVLYFTVRAHGVGERSMTVLADRVEEFDQLARVLFETDYTSEDTGAMVQVRLACIDSGYRTDEVYAFCSAWADRARPTKGHQRRATPLVATSIERDFIGRSGGLQLWNVDTTYYKDKLVRQIHADVGTQGSWSVHADPSDHYCLQMVSEHKVLVRGKGTNITSEWRPKPGSSGNHWWDCEVLNQVAADMLGVYTLRDETHEPRRAATTSVRRERDEGAGKRTGFIRKPGWRKR